MIGCADQAIEPETDKTTSEEIVTAVVYERFDQEEVRCLALNTYHEARDQSLAGQIATAMVVMNRVNSEYFPDSICEVVTQGPTYTNWKGNQWPVRNQCQFSWYCDGKDDEPFEIHTYEQVEQLIINLSANDYIDYTDGSLYYHADYVKPDWSNDYTVSTQIDNHIFYKRN